MIPTLLVISLLSFAIIQLPPGDYLTSYIAALAESGETVREDEIAGLRARYNLDQPFFTQYLKWLNGLSPFGFDVLRHGPIDGMARGQDGALGRWTGPWEGQTTCADTRLQVKPKERSTRPFATDVPAGKTVFLSVKMTCPKKAPQAGAVALLAEEKIGLGLAGGHYVMRLFGPDHATTWGQITPGKAHRLVAKLEFNADGNRERLTMWVDPSGSEKGEHTQTLLFDTDLDTLAGPLAVTGQPTGQTIDGKPPAVQVDDVRLGTTWEAVTKGTPAAGQEDLVVADSFAYFYNRVSGWPHWKPIDMGISFTWDKPVLELIGERILLTIIISICTLIFTWCVAIPIGIISAVKQHSWFDYFFTFIGFIGLATPSFLLALIFMYIGQEAFGVSAGGLFSPEYQSADWSWARFVDLLKHVWVPVVVIGMAGTAGLIRIMRGNLLDELRKQYVVTARAKGVRRVKMLLKYPVRVAINPLVSTIGWLLPSIVSGSVIVSVVMGLPTTGAMLLPALMDQDMYLAGSMVMMLSSLTVIGTLISDLLLLWLDPRIRLGRKEA